MCNRYTAQNPVLTGEMVFEEFDIRWPHQPARFNVAPGELLPSIVRRDDLLPEAREMRWGFVPNWEKSDNPKIAPTNAMSETVAEKPMFKRALQKRRCLIPADGFIEWQKISAKEKQPFHFTMTDGRPFYFAGIFELGNESLPGTFAILTTAPNKLMEPIHNRMPVILRKAAAKEWLNAEQLTAGDLRGLTAPFPAEDMKAVAVSRLISNSRNDFAEALAPYVPEPTLF